jgi:hypothetical protein
MKQKLTDRLAALRNPAPIDAGIYYLTQCLHVKAYIVFQLELLADEIQYQIHNSSEELPDLKG